MARRRGLPVGIYKPAGSKYYYCDLRDHRGRRIRESTRCTDVKAAVLAKKRRERELADPAHALASSVTFGKAAERFLEYLSTVKGRAQGTIDFYRRKAGTLRRILGLNRPLVEITAAVVDSYVTQRLGPEGVGRHTVTGELVTLGGILRLARRRGEYVSDPRDVMPINWERGYRPRTRSLQWSEIHALVKAATELSPAMAAWIRFIVATGASPTEAEYALDGDIDWERKVVLIRGTKTEDRWRYVPIIEHEQLPLASLLWGVSLPLKRLDPSYRSRMMARACKAAGIEHTQTRDLRRTSGSRVRELIGEGGLTGLFLGHANATMSDKVYARLQGEALGRAIATAIGKTKETQ